MSHSTDHNGASHGSVKSYMTGFILSIILPILPIVLIVPSSPALHRYHQS